MFKGKGCSDRCMNSIKILQRQKAASKLENCYCQGNEDGYDCQTIKTNMQELCFNQIHEIETNEIDVDNDDNPFKKKTNSSAASGIIAKLHRFLLIFSLFATIFFKMIQTSFETMIHSL